ncbi:Uncharacterised protein [Mycobacteroides abscessus subsp. massiliense]|nr:Uncharacterised protein [Mycobacteroides abscessus subsp. massiliense]
MGVVGHPIQNCPNGSGGDIDDGTAVDVELRRDGGIEVFEQIRADPAVKILASLELPIDHRLGQPGAFGDRLHGNLGAGRGFVEQRDGRLHDPGLPRRVVPFPACLVPGQ